LGTKESRGDEEEKICGERMGKIREDGGGEKRVSEAR
jgi:hypothetical protein